MNGRESKLKNREGRGSGGKARQLLGGEGNEKQMGLRGRHDKRLGWDRRIGERF